MHVSMPLCGVEAGQLFYTRAVIKWLVERGGGNNNLIIPFVSRYCICTVVVLVYGSGTYPDGYADALLVLVVIVV